VTVPTIDSASPAPATVFAFEGQGARTIPGAVPVEVASLAPAAAQQAIVRHQVARARACGATVPPGPTCRFAVVGQSLGELSAFVVAGSLALDDAVELARLRAELPATLLPPHAWTMASMTRLAPDAAAAAADGLDVWVVGENGPKDCIVVGQQEAFASFVARAGAKPATYRELPVSHPYHTPLMAPVAEELRSVVASCEVRAPAVTVLSPTGPREVVDADGVRAVLVAALTTPVSWAAVLRLAAERWPSAAYRECGPSCSLHRFVWKNELALDWAEAAPATAEAS